MTVASNKPEGEQWGLLFPFIACHTHGGPYDDNAFVAGYQAGRIERSLAAMTPLDADRATFTVYTTIVPQLELIGMHHGFPVVTATQVAEAEDGSYPAMPEWSTVVFSRGGR